MIFLIFSRNTRQHLNFRKSLSEYCALHYNPSKVRSSSWPSWLMMNSTIPQIRHFTHDLLYYLRAYLPSSKESSWELRKRWPDAIFLIFSEYTQQHQNFWKRVSEYSANDYNPAKGGPASDCSKLIWLLKLDNFHISGVSHFTNLEPTELKVRNFKVA